jgi:crossover junction endodeoxyribonuclease RuvC
VLGIDPGTIKMGWAIMQHQGSNVSLLECGCFKEKTTMAMSRRLLSMHYHLCDVVKKYKPDVVCIEKAFVGVNAASALSLGCARGVVMVVAEMCGARIQERSASAAKKGLTGKGRATKEEVIQAVNRFFSIQAGEDAADAVAMAFSADGIGGISR